MYEDATVRVGQPMRYKKVEGRLEEIPIGNRGSLDDMLEEEVGEISDRLFPVDLNSSYAQWKSQGNTGFYDTEEVQDSIMSQMQYADHDVTETVRRVPTQPQYAQPQNTNRQISQYSNMSRVKLEQLLENAILDGDDDTEEEIMIELQNR